MTDQPTLPFDGRVTPMPLFHEAPRVIRPARDADGRRLTIQEAFQLFHQANPWVYRSLVALSRDLLARNRRRIGVKMLFEVLRWHYWRATADPTSDFKLNNNYHSRYARLMMAQEPDLADAFEIRELKAP